jgi:hypothetical protein
VRPERVGRDPLEPAQQRLGIGLGHPPQRLGRPCLDHEFHAQILANSQDSVKRKTGY